MNAFWKNKQVLVTGGAGFIGSHLVKKLLKNKAEVTILDNMQNGLTENLLEVKNEVAFIKGDCRDRTTADKACKGKDIVMNLAALVYGVDYNKAHPGTMLSQNILIEATMTEAARKRNVERFLAVSSACVYPQDVLIPTPEHEGFRNGPETPNKGYGWAKRVAELLGQYYSEEFGMKIAIVRPYNCYGPRDHFFPKPMHVIPSLIQRVCDGEDPVIVWGSGKQTRAFLYVDDLVDGMISAIEKYPLADPINLGSDEEITMKELVKLIIKLSGSKAKVVFDTTKPDGSPRRKSDNKKAKKTIGFAPSVPLMIGLQKTIEWYNMKKKKK